MGYFTRLWAAAVVAAIVAWSIRIAVHPHQRLFAAVVILVPYGAAYLGLAAAMGINESKSLIKRLKRN